MSEMVLRFFGEAKGVHAMRQMAGNGNVRNIVNPHLTLFATGIPKFFYAALNEKALENGLLGRCLFLDTEEFCPLGEMKPQSLLWALSENPDNPLITADAVIWATKLVSHLTKRMLYLSQFYVAEGKFDRLKKRALAIMAKNGGQIDQSSLLRSLHVDAQTLNKIILTLHMCDMIEEERLSRRKVVFTLKGAA